MLDSDSYDTVILGTGLAQSIAAAALAKAGKSVLHLDPNEYYGGAQASLTLDEFATWAAERSEQPTDADDEYTSAQHSRYESASTTPLGSLAPDRRRYALSLFPSLMASRGTLVGTLIASDVSKYVGFRLLDSVSLWDDAKGAAARVPGSKEDVFKDKSVSLPDKRRLMKALLFAAGEFEEDEVLKGHEEEPLLAFLTRSFGLSQRLAEALTYAVAHASSPDEPALPSLIRARRYIRSIGRYGPRAFLVGQYGGAGEVAQGFCRACAVFGGTYILGPDAVPSDITVANDNASVSLKIPGHPRTITATHLVCSPDFLPASLKPESIGTKTTAYTVAVVATRPPVLAPANAAEEGEEEEEGDDTAVLVFPPTDTTPLVRALVMGEGTGSCPQGQWVVYLWAETGDVKSLQPFLGKVAPEGVSWQASYVEHAAQAKPAASEETGASPLVILEPYAGPHLLTEGLDWEAAQGERAFTAVAGDDEHGFFEKAEDEDDEEDGDDE